MQQNEEEARQAALRREVERLNRLCPVGTPVCYWTMGPYAIPTFGAIYAPWSLLGGHTVVAWIRGCVGCVAAPHVMKLVGVPMDKLEDGQGAVQLREGAPPAPPAENIDPLEDWL